MDALTFAIAVLAAYRIATDIAWTEGPGGVFLELRGWAWRRYGADDWRTKGLQCPVCISFWAALPLAVMLALAWGLTLVWLAPVWLAVAGGAAYLARRT